MTILRPIPPSPSQFAMTSFPAPTKMHYQKIPRARASASARREAHTHFWRVVERFPSASPHLAAAVASRTSSEVAMHSAVPVVGAYTGHSPSRFPVPITKPLPPPVTSTPGRCVSLLSAFFSLASLWALLMAAFAFYGVFRFVQASGVPGSGSHGPLPGKSTESSTAPGSRRL